MVEEEASMRIYRNLIILVVVMVVLIGAYVVVDRLKGPEGTGFEEIEVIKLDKEKVLELTVENSDGKFVSKKNETEWEYITTGKKYVVDKTRLDSIASNICDLYANKVVEENAKDLSKYGLDTPVTITAKTSDGQVAQIEVGDLTPTQQGYYIKKKDQKTVYTVAYYTGLMLNASKSDLRNKYIFDVTSADVTALAVTKNGKMSFIK